MKKNHCRILIVDDNALDAEVYTNFLRRERSCEYEIVVADSGADALAMARMQIFDCIVLDYNLPDIDGLGLLGELIPDPTDVDQPVVVITGVGSESVAVDMMKRGSQDYLPKGDVTQASLVQAVHNAIEKVALRREVKRQKEALERSREEQLALKDRFLSHVSHELRTPLAAIDQFLSLVLDGIAGEISESQREYLEIASRNTRQLTKMIADLMDVARAQSHKLRIEPCRLELASLLELSLPHHTAAAEAGDIELRAAIETPLPAVLADEVRVQQVVSNLLENSLKFTPPGGEIELGAMRDPESPEFVRVWVRDTGCGMSEEAASRIFDRLYQAGGEQRSSREGLGLGLSICQELVTSLGGRIWVESKPEAGSTFQFTLPVFALEQLIRPALYDGDQLRDTVSVVRVRARRSNGSPLSDSEARKVHHTLGRLVYYPQIDVLIPRRLAGPKSDTLFVVAAADAPGFEALRGRVERFLGGSQSGFESLEIFVDGETLEVGAGSDSEETALERVARRVEKLILKEE